MPTHRLSLLLLLAAISCYRPVQSCSCFPRTLCEAFSDSGLVVVRGNVTSETKTNVTYSTYINEMRVYAVVVLEVYKNNASSVSVSEGSVIEATSEGDGAMCGAYLTLHREHLLFLSPVAQSAQSQNSSSITNRTTFDFSSCSNTFSNTFVDPSSDERDPVAMCSSAPTQFATSAPTIYPTLAPTGTSTPTSAPTGFTSSAPPGFNSSAPPSLTSFTSSASPGFTYHHYHTLLPFLLALYALVFPSE